MKIKKYIVYETQLDTLKTVCRICELYEKRNYMLEYLVKDIEEQEIKPRKRKRKSNERVQNKRETA